MSLLEASKNGNLQGVKKLLDEGADVNEQNDVRTHFLVDCLSLRVMYDRYTYPTLPYDSEPYLAVAQRLGMQTPIMRELRCVLCVSTVLCVRPYVC